VTKEAAMPIGRILFASLLLLAPVSIAAAEDTPAATAAPQEPQWTDFRSAERGFAVSFPGAPSVTSAPVEGQNPLLQHTFQASVGEDTVYSVVVFEYPSGKAPNPPESDYYLKLVNAYAKGSDTRVRKKAAATINELKGYEAMTQDAAGKFTHLIDIVPGSDRIYMVVSAGPKNHFKSEDAVRFRDSFRVIGDHAQSAATPSAQPNPSP
jgi:hypothetical protein